MPVSPHNAISVDIVIPVYNGERFIIEALESVRNQTHQNFFCYVVDDGSTDSTFTVVQKFISDHQDKRFVLIHQDNSGQARARNVAMRSGNSDYIFFLDADDTYGQNHLEASITRLSTEEELGGTYARFLLHPDSIDNRKSPHQNNYYYNKDSEPVQYIRSATEVLEHHRLITSPTMLTIRRSILTQVGYFDEQLQGPEDTDFLIRLCSVYPLAYLPESLVYIRIHPSSFTLRDGIFQNYLSLAQKHQTMLAGNPYHAKLIGSFIASTLTSTIRQTINSYFLYKEKVSPQIHKILFPGTLTFEYLMLRSFVRNRVSPHFTLKNLTLLLKKCLPSFLYVALRKVWRMCRS